MILADTVLVADRTAVFHDQFRGCGLELLPAREGFLIAVAHPEHVRGVNAAALAVKMRQMGENVGALLLVSQSLTKIGLDQPEEIIDVVPIGGRFQGVDGVAICQRASLR